MLIGIRDFPNQMGAAGVTQNGLHFTDEAKFGLDWLQEMWDDQNRIFYYQIDFLLSDCIGQRPTYRTANRVQIPYPSR
jgi:hypothetical protein